MKLNFDKSTSLAEIKRAPKQLAAGLSIMLVCSLAGGAILSTQNQTETLLVLNRDVAAGDAVSPEYFESREVLVSTLNSQWLRPDEISEESYFAISLSKGDAMRAADISKISSDLRTLSFAVEETNLPSNLRPGDLLDFWDVGLDNAKLLASGLSVQAVSLIENRGIFKLSLLVNTFDVAEILASVENESFRLLRLESA